MKERKEENNGNGTEEKKGCEETRESIIKMVGDR